MNLFMMELYKLTKKKTSWFLMAMTLMPVLYAWGMYTDSSILQIDFKNAQITCTDYVYLLWNLMLVLGLPSIFMILIGAFNLSAELEMGQLGIILVRECRREKIVIAKCFAIACWILLFSLVFVIAASLAYFIFVAPSKYGNGQFYSDQTPRYAIELLFSYLDFLLLSVLTLLLGTKLKTQTNIIGMLMLMVLLKVGEWIPLIKNFMPGQIRQMNWQSLFDGSQHWLQFGGYLSLFLFYIGLALWLTIKQIQRLDIK